MNEPYHHLLESITGSVACALVDAQSQRLLALYPADANPDVLSEPIAVALMQLCFGAASLARLDASTSGAEDASPNEFQSLHARGCTTQYFVQLTGQGTAMVLAAENSLDPAEGQERLSTQLAGWQT